MTAALILGHSFVKRLRYWMRRYGRVMSLKNLTVHLHGVGGRTIDQTYQDMDVVDSLRPDVIFLQVGGNDISDSSTATEIFVKLKRLIAALLNEHHVSTVIVGSIFCRNRPRNISQVAYDRKKRKINRFLCKEFGGFEPGKKVFFFTHKFFKGNLFDDDGVHLNDSGNRRFFNSIQSALRLILATG